MLYAKSEGKIFQDKI